jgi:hypothetical protein
MRLDGDAFTIPADESVIGKWGGFSPTRKLACEAAIPPIGWIDLARNRQGNVAATFADACRQAGKSSEGIPALVQKVLAVVK